MAWEPWLKQDEKDDSSFIDNLIDISNKIKRREKTNPNTYIPLKEKKNEETDGIGSDGNSDSVCGVQR